MWRIVHRTQGWIAASGFYSVERAERWLASFNPKMWTDKTLRQADFVIVTEAGAIAKAQGDAK
jgi:hypothetical protein